MDELPGTQSDRYYYSLVDLVRRRLGVRWLLLQGNRGAAAFAARALAPGVSSGEVVSALQRGDSAADARALFQDAPELQAGGEETEERDEAVSCYRHAVSALVRAAAREAAKCGAAGGPSPLADEAGQAWEASGFELGPFLRDYLRAGPHDLFPASPHGSLDPGASVCARAGEAGTWRHATVVSSPQAVGQCYQVEWSLAPPLGGDGPTVEAVAGSCVKRRAAWADDEAVWGDFVHRLSFAMLDNTDGAVAAAAVVSDEEARSGLRRGSCLGRLCAALGADRGPLSLAHDVCDAWDGGGEASKLASSATASAALSALEGWVKASVLGLGVSKKDVALAHSALGGRTRPTNAMGHRAWRDLAARSSCDSGASVGAAASLTVGGLERVLGSLRFGRDSLELSDGAALPRRLARELAEQVAASTAACSTAACSTAAGSAASAPNPAATTVIGASALLAWCAPVRPVAALRAHLLATLTTLHAGDADAFYDALDADGDGSLSPAEVAVRLALPEVGGGLLLSDGELDALLAQADVGGSKDGKGRGDGEISRAEWWGLLHPKATARAQGGSTAEDEAPVVRGSTGPVTLAKFVAYCQAELRTDLSWPDLAVLFARAAASAAHSRSLSSAASSEAAEVAVPISLPGGKGSRLESAEEVSAALASVSGGWSLLAGAPAAVDACMELDLARFDEFQRLLRSFLLKRMAEDETASGVAERHTPRPGDSPAMKAERGARLALEQASHTSGPLHKRGARAWVLRLRGLFEAVDADRSGSIDDGELLRFVTNLFRGDEAAAVATLVLPAFRLHRPADPADRPVGASGAGAAFGASGALVSALTEACEPLVAAAALRRYIARFVDGCDLKGKRALGLDELEAFLKVGQAAVSADGVHEVEVPTAVASARYCFGRLVDPGGPSSGAGDGSGNLVAVFHAVAAASTKDGKLTKNGSLDAHALRKALMGCAGVHVKNPLPAKLLLGRCANLSGGGPALAPSVSAQGKVRPLTASGAAAVCRRLDSFNEGFVSFDEFEGFLAPPRDREQLKAALNGLVANVIDPPGSVAALCRSLDDGNGIFGQGEIELGLSRLGLRLTKTEAAALFEGLSSWLHISGLPNLRPPLSPDAEAPSSVALTFVTGLCFLDGGGAPLVSRGHLAARARGLGLPEMLAAAAVQGDGTSDGTCDGTCDGTGSGAGKCAGIDTWAERDASLQSTSVLLARSVAVACYPQFANASPFLGNVGEASLAVFGADARVWAPHLRRARVELGRRASPAAVLARALAMGELSGDTAGGVSPPPTLELVTAWVALEDALSVGSRVVEDLGPAPFRVLGLVLGPGDGSRDAKKKGLASEAEAKPRVASLVRCAGLLVHEAVARAVSGASGVSRVVCEVEHSGQVLCLSAGKGATVSSLLPQIALLTGVDTSSGGGAGGGGFQRQLRSLTAAVGLEANLTARFSTADGTSVDARALVATLDLKQGGDSGGLVAVDSLAVGPEWYDAHHASAAVESITAGVSVGLSLFVSVPGGASGAAKARARLAYVAALPSTKIGQGALDVSAVGTEGGPNAASFQCELGRHFPHLVPHTCPGEKCARDLLVLAARRRAAAQPPAARGTAATGGGIRGGNGGGMSRLQLRRLRQRGLDGCDLVAILEEQEDEGGDSDLLGLSADLVSPGRKPAWAQDVEAELARLYAPKGKGEAAAKAIAPKSQATAAALALIGTKHKGSRDKAASPRGRASGELPKPVNVSATTSATRRSQTTSAATLAPAPPRSGRSAKSDGSPPPAYPGGPHGGPPVAVRALEAPSEDEDEGKQGQGDAVDAQGIAGDIGLPLRSRFFLRRDGGVTFTLDLESSSSSSSSSSSGNSGNQSGRDFPLDADAAVDGGASWSVVSSEAAQCIEDVVAQAMALCHLQRWERSLYCKGKTNPSAQRRCLVVACLPGALRLGPRLLASLAALQLRLKSKWRRRTTHLLNELREARAAGAAWELRCSRLEADAKAQSEAAGRTAERLESQLRRLKRRAVGDAAAAGEAAAALAVEVAKREAAAASALREAEEAVGDAVLQERQRCTKYWRGRIEGTYGERESRVRSLLAFAGAEVEGIAASLGNRGPSQLDEDRTRLRALARRIRMEATSESDPLPVAFARTGDNTFDKDKATATAASKSAPGVKAAPFAKAAHSRLWGQAQATALGAVSQRHSSTAGSMGAAPSRALGPSAREIRDRSKLQSDAASATAKTAKVMDEGIEKMRELLLRIKEEQRQGANKVASAPLSSTSTAQLGSRRPDAIAGDDVDENDDSWTKPPAEDEEEADEDGENAGGGDGGGMQRSADSAELVTQGEAPMDDPFGSDGDEDEGEDEEGPGDDEQDDEEEDDD